ncbi:MAG: PQQ-dependent sugar dehydrogenase [Chloroflexota bacterium]
MPTLRPRPGRIGAAAALVLLSILLVPAAPASAAAPHLQLVAGALDNPVFLTSARDGTGRLFVIEQTGKIRIIKNGAVLPTPFINLGSRIRAGGEQGLLGLAFHPSFSTNRKFYVNYTRASDGATIVEQYQQSPTNPDRAYFQTAVPIMRIFQPYANHNGGMLAFGPDGYLYVGMGDGGSSGDPGNRAQSIDSLLGKLLRIDVNRTVGTRKYSYPPTNPYVGKPGLDQIWARGLRNPWRFSFDRATGDLWIGDVGQNRYEEIDRATQSTGGGRGANFGWRVMEGRHCYSPMTGCSTTFKTMPLVEYSHSEGCSVTGGYVYRGSAIPALAGSYLFSDFCSGSIWQVASGAASPAAKTLLFDTSLSVSSFGEDATNELYVLDLNGSVYKLVP